MRAERLGGVEYKYNKRDALHWAQLNSDYSPRNLPVLGQINSESTRN